MNGVRIFLLCAAGAASPAALGQFLANPLTITVSNALGSTTTVITAADGDSIPGGFLWSGGEIELRDDVTNDLLATFSQGSVRAFDSALVPDFPTQVAFGYNITAIGGDTTVTIETGEWQITPPDDQIVRATSSIALTDLLDDGASVVGNFSDGSIYQSSVNETLLTSSLHSSLTVAAGGAAPVTETLTDPLSGIPVGLANEPFEPIGGSISSISARVSFVLSEGDNVNGTTAFFVVPTPAAASLVLAGLGIGFRSRSRA